jgi:hypothetical protein
MIAQLVGLIIGGTDTTRVVIRARRPARTAARWSRAWPGCRDDAVLHRVTPLRGKLRPQPCSPQRRSSEPPTSESLRPNNFPDQVFLAYHLK